MRAFILTSFIILFCGIAAAQTQQIGQPLLCHGCVAVIKELHKILKDSSGRFTTVTRGVSRLCQLDNFVSYTFSPPKMIKACIHITKNHEQELVESLTDFYRKYKTKDNLLLQEQFCEKKIKACEGVRRPTKDSEMKPHGFSMDDANQKLNDAAMKSFTPHQMGEDDNFQIPKPPFRATPHEEL